MVVMANEVSATISVYYLKNINKTVGTTTGLEDIVSQELAVYPNPAETKVYFNQPTSFEIFSISGVKLIEETDKVSVDISALENGIYIIRNQDGKTTRLTVSH